MDILICLFLILGQRFELLLIHLHTRGLAGVIADGFTKGRGLEGTCQRKQSSLQFSPILISLIWLAEREMPR